MGMFTERFFNLLLNLEDGWEVKSVKSDIDKEEIVIEIQCLLKSFEEEGETQRFYDFAPERRWRHLDTLQYKTYIACRLPRVKNASGKVVTIDPPWASSHQRNTYLFECAVIDLLQTSRNQTKTAKLMRCGLMLSIKSSIRALYGGWRGEKKRMFTIHI